MTHFALIVGIVIGLAAPINYWELGSSEEHWFRITSAHDTEMAWCIVRNDKCLECTSIVCPGAEKTCSVPILATVANIYARHAVKKEYEACK